MRQTNVPAGRVELSVHHGRPRPRAQPGFGGQKAADALEDGHDHHHVGALRGREQAPGGLGHRERRRSSVRLAGAAARFDAVPARAHAAGGVRMRFRHRAARVEHQQAPALRAHQASRSHRTVIGRCGFAFAWRGTCKFIECHVSWPLSSVAALL